MCTPVDGRCEPRDWWFNLSIQASSELVVRHELLNLHRLYSVLASPPSARPPAPTPIEIAPSHAFTRLLTPPHVPLYITHPSALCRRLTPTLASTSPPGPHRALHIRRLRHAALAARQHPPPLLLNTLVAGAAPRHTIAVHTVCPYEYYRMVLAPPSQSRARASCAF